MFRWNRFQPPEDGLPPKDVRLTELSVERWPEDTHRVRVSVELTPYQQPPNLEFTLLDPGEEEVSTIYMVEVIDGRMTFTMHLRDGGTNPPYTLQARILYSEDGAVFEQRIPVPQEPENDPEE